MIVLVLLACHMLGDYVLQTRWQASRKLVQPSYRLRHVTVYTLPFVPVAVLCARHGHLAWERPFTFLVALWVLHFATDSQRFLSNIGDWLAHAGYWYLHWREVVAASPNFTPDQKRSGARPPKPVLSPNPWAPLPMMLDQTLHVCQLAALGWFLLR